MQDMLVPVKGRNTWSGKCVRFYQTTHTLIVTFVIWSIFAVRERNSKLKIIIKKKVREDSSLSWFCSKAHYTALNHTPTTYLLPTSIVNMHVKIFTCSVLTSCSTAGEQLWGRRWHSSAAGLGRPCSRRQPAGRSPPPRAEERSCCGAAGRLPPRLQTPLRVLQAPEGGGGGGRKKNLPDRAGFHTNTEQKPWQKGAGIILYRIWWFCFTDLWK